MPSNSQQTKAGRMLGLVPLFLLSACSDPNAALNEREAKAEAAAQRAEAAAAKAEQAVAKIEQAKSAASMVDGGPQLTPEPVQQPQPIEQPAMDSSANGEAPTH